MMNWKAAALTAGILAWGIPSGWAGEITGMVEFKGEDPDPIKMPVHTNPQCAHLYGEDEEKPVMDFFKVGKKGGLADVLVYIKKGLPEKDYPVPEKPAILDQVGCVYKPYVLSMQTGQKLQVLNSDKGVLHNVHVPEMEPVFNKIQLATQGPFDFTFKEPKRFLHFKCDVHPWMHAYVNVVPHPYHGVTGPDGKFKFEDVPAGDYVIEAHHRKLGKHVKEVTLENEGDTGSVSFTLVRKEKKEGEKEGE